MFTRILSSAPTIVVNVDGNLNEVYLKKKLNYDICSFVVKKNDIEYTKLAEIEIKRIPITKSEAITSMNTYPNLMINMCSGASIMLQPMSSGIHLLKMSDSGVIEKITLEDLASNYENESILLFDSDLKDFYLDDVEEIIELGNSAYDDLPESENDIIEESEEEALADSKSFKNYILKIDSGIIINRFFIC